MLKKFEVSLRVKSVKRGGSKKYTFQCEAFNSDAAVETAMQRVARLKGLPALDPNRVIESSVREVEGGAEEMSVLAHFRHFHR